jgi:hypothetical protein
MARLSMDRRARSDSRGQILPLFVIFLTTMLLMSSLLLDGASALLMKREYQIAADAAALAGANVSGFQNNGCSASLDSATTAAKASVAANLPGFDPSKVVVTCPTAAPYTNIAVQVSLSGTSPGFFSQVAGISVFAVGTSATAINGPITPGHYSVTLLDPTGCPSASFAGSFTAQFDGSLFVDSSCSSGPQQAIYGGGNSGSITFAAGSGAYVVGEYSGNPALFKDVYGNLLPPTRVQDPTSDPFLTLPAPAVPAAGSSTPCTGGIGDVYSPGSYPGGIQVKKSAFLKPGIYYMMDASSGGGSGGLQVAAGGALYSVSSSFDKTMCFTDPTQWPTYCPVTGSDCGVVIVNAAAPTDASKDNIAVSGNASFMVRPYQPSLLTPPGVKAYENFLIWQLAYDQSKNALPQPVVQLAGGGNVVMTGGVYAPAAMVSMDGGSGGVGGDLTIQFISWDLHLQGSPAFNFVYNSDAFPRPMGYGLVQ